MDYSIQRSPKKLIYFKISTFYHLKRFFLLILTELKDLVFFSVNIRLRFNNIWQWDSPFGSNFSLRTFQTECLLEISVNLPNSAIPWKKTRCRNFIWNLFTAILDFKPVETQIRMNIKYEALRFDDSLCCRASGSFWLTFVA